MAIYIDAPPATAPCVLGADFVISRSSFSCCPLLVDGTCKAFLPYTHCFQFGVGRKRKTRKDIYSDKPDDVKTSPSRIADKQELYLCSLNLLSRLRIQPRCGVFLAEAHHTSVNLPTTVTRFAATMREFFSVKTETAYHRQGPQAVAIITGLSDCAPRGNPLTEDGMHRHFRRFGWIAGGNSA